MSKFTDWFGSILKNASGEFEVGRSMLVASNVTCMTTPVGFTFLDMWHNGWHFDPTAYCLSLGGMLTAVNGTGVFTIGRKERDVAIARQTAAQPPLGDQQSEQK